MSDVSIVNTTVTSTPKDYKVPGSQELLVKAVRASIDGSAAGSSFLPALQLLDPAGNVMWTAVDTGTTVAAGGSADVSWFPGVKKGATSSTSTGGLPWCLGVNDNTSLPSGNTFTKFTMHGAFFFGDTSDNTVMDFADDGTGNYGIQLKANGLYLVQGLTGINPIADRTLAKSAEAGLLPTPSAGGGADLLSFQPDVGGTVAYARPEIWGTYNLDPGSTPPPITVTLSARQNSGGALTATGSLVAVRINPKGSPNF